MTAQLLHANIADVASDLGQYTTDHRFKRLLLVTPWLILEFPHLRFLDELLALFIRGFDEMVFLGSEDGTGDDVVDAEGETNVC